MFDKTPRAMALLGTFQQECAEAILAFKQSPEQTPASVQEPAPEQPTATSRWQGATPPSKNDVASISDASTDTTPTSPTIEPVIELVSDEPRAVTGKQFECGYLSLHFVNQPESHTVVLHDPYVLLVDKYIDHFSDLFPVLALVCNTDDPLLIVARGVDECVLNTLEISVLRGILDVCAVWAHGPDDTRRAMLEDMAVLTGGTVITEDGDLSLDKVTLAQLGQAKRVEVGRENTTIDAVTVDTSEGIPELILPSTSKEACCILRRPAVL